MKKIIILFITILSVGNLVIGQGKFSANVSNNTSILTFSIRPSATITTNFSVIEFFLRYPIAGSPVFTYGPVTVNTTDFPGMTGTGALGSGSWEIQRDNPAYILPTYHVDHFLYTAPAPVTAMNTYNINQSYAVFTVQCQGLPPSTVNFDFVHQDTEASAYLAITNGVGVDLRPLSFLNYFYPSTASQPGPPVSTIYYMNLPAVPVPIKFGGFTAVKKDNNALLNWQVENESAITDRYEVERSLNGVSFTKFATVAPRLNGGTNSYDLKDLNLSQLRSSGIIYYRIKQVDKDDKYVYSEIRSIRMDGKGFAVNVYPNPVKDITILTLDLIDAADVAITITDAAGKEVQKIDMQGMKGFNVQKINMKNMASGSYMIKVKAGIEMKTLPGVKGQ